MNKKYTIAFDASMITDKNAGIGYYARELLYNLSTKADIYAFTNNDLLIQNENIKVFKIEGKVNLLWHLKVFFYIKKLKVDAIVSPSNFIYAILSNKTIQIVHDLAPIRYPSHYGYISSFKFRIYLKLATYRALALATVSQTTSKDLERFAKRVKNKIFTIGIGLNSHFLPKDYIATDILSRLNLSPKKYILSVGTLQPRKNYEKSILAFEKFKKDYPDYKFVIVGQKGWKYDRIFELISNRKLGESVIITGFVSENDLKTLYKNASVYLSTSLWEGFGLPLIEAYYFDLPLVVSDIEIFHEVVENNALFVDPNSENEIKAALIKVISGKQKTNDKSFLSKYSWEKVSEKILKVLDKNKDKE